MVTHKLLLAAVYMAAAAMITAMAEPSIQRLTVQVTNKLSDKILIVHCRSKDDDLGAHAVDINGSFGWGFNINAFGTTVYWCDLAVEDKRLSFTAFGPEIAYYDNLYVYADGVYGKNALRDQRLVGLWKRNWLVP